MGYGLLFTFSEVDFSFHFNCLTQRKRDFLMTVPVRCTAFNRAQLSNESSNEEMNFTLSDWMLNHVLLPQDSNASTKRPSTPHFESKRARGCTNGARKFTACTMRVPSVK